MTGSVPRLATVRDMQLTAVWKNADIKREEYERKYGRKIHSVLLVAGTRIAAQYETQPTADSALSVLQDVLTDPLREVLSDLFYEVELAFGRDALRSFRARPIGKATEEQDPFDVWDPYESPQAREWNRIRTATHITSIGERTRRLIRRLIQDSLEQGRDTRTIARILRSSFGFSRIRSFLIARTEINAASNAGTRFAVQTHVNTTGLVKVWLSTKDGRVRPSHDLANGQRRQFDEPYIVGAGKLMFPGDTSLGAPGEEIIGCRCTEYYLRNPRAVRRP